MRMCSPGKTYLDIIWTDGVFFLTCTVVFQLLLGSCRSNLLSEI